MKRTVIGVTLLAAAVVMYVASSCPGAQPAVAMDTSYRQIVNTFLQKMIAGNTGEAVDYIYSGNPWIQRKSDAVAKVRNTLTTFPTVGGRCLKAIRLGEKNVGGRYVCLYYLVCYERQPLAFSFEFYKPRENWMVYSFSFDDKLDEHAQQALLEEVFNGR